MMYDGDHETRLSTSLSRRLPRSPTTPEDMEMLRRRAWQRDGVLSLRESDDRLTWPERELLRQVGDRLYGGRARQECNRHGGGSQTTSVGQEG